MIIGLTGLMASGKSTLVNILKKQGFKHISLSDMAQKEAERESVKGKKENLMTAEQYVKGEYGTSILAKRAKEKIEAQGNKNWVIDDIQNPAEITELLKLPSFVLIENTAPEDLLVKRILERKHPDDPLDEKSIRKKIRQQLGHGQPPEGQQVYKCMEMANFSFINTMPIEEVEEAFMKLYNRIKLHF